MDRAPPASTHCRSILKSISMTLHYLWHVLAERVTRRDAAPADRCLARVARGATLPTAPVVPGRRDQADHPWTAVLASSRASATLGTYRRAISSAVLATGIPIALGSLMRFAASSINRAQLRIWGHWQGHTGGTATEALVLTPANDSIQSEAVGHGQLVQHLPLDQRLEVIGDRQGQGSLSHKQS